MDSRQHWPRLWVFLSYIVVGATALWLRIADLGLFISGDEANFWIRRSEVFWAAIRSGDYGATALTEHPGVTTMWLGSLGIWLQNVFADSGFVISHSFASYLGFVRLPLAIVHIGSIVVGYWLLRRLFPSAIALLAALLWASDPFVVAFSRFLHVDGLMTTFATLSFLLACYYWYHKAHFLIVIASGVCAGLAILSKSPALILLPTVFAVAYLSHILQRPSSCTPNYLLQVFRRTLPIFVLWCGVCAVTIVALWPALWVDPLRVYELFQAGVVIEGGEPHDLGNFFLGRPDDAPGLLYYPLALVLRSTPLTLLGIILVPFVLRTLPSISRHHVYACVGFVLLFVAVMSVFPKKFDRYIVPVFPLIDIIAAVGLVGGIYFLARMMMVGWQPKFIASALSVMGALAFVNALLWHPYGIAAFNQLLGGTATGTRTFQAGWGEGYEQVAAWLNEQPDITGVLTVSGMRSSLQPFLREGAQTAGPENMQLPDASGYVVVYLRQVQRGQLSAPYNQFYQRVRPLHTVTIHGVEYAWIYQAPPAVAQSRYADFGNQIRLLGYEQQDSVDEESQDTSFDFTLFWEVQKPPSQDYMLFAHLIGPDGQRHAQIDLPYSQDIWQGRPYVEMPLSLQFPAELQSGNYQLIIGLYDQESGERLPLESETVAAPEIAGPNAVCLIDIRIE
ncbi:MAG: glycosyltransferase family 39 protein [Chloroflexota bacterium]